MPLLCAWNIIFVETNANIKGFKISTSGLKLPSEGQTINSSGPKPAWRGVGGSWCHRLPDSISGVVDLRPALINVAVITSELSKLKDNKRIKGWVVGGLPLFEKTSQKIAASFSLKYL